MAISKELSNLLDEAFPHLVTCLIYQAFQLKSFSDEGERFQKIDLEGLDQMTVKEKLDYGIEMLTASIEAASIIEAKAKRDVSTHSAGDLNPLIENLSHQFMEKICGEEGL